MQSKTSYILVVFLFTLLAFPACSQTNIILPSNFVETPVPKQGSDKWRKMNHSFEEFSIKIKNSKVQINEVEANTNAELKLSNGNLIGINRGEWGGKLFFIPSDTTQKHVEIKHGNIEFIFEFDDKIYFIEGLAHMGMSEGALFELETKNANFSYKKIIDFEDAPQAFIIFNKKLFIASYQNFYVIENLKSKLIFENIFWASLYPNSIAVFDEENIFVGIRGGIVKINLPQKSFILYTKK